VARDTPRLTPPEMPDVDDYDWVEHTRDTRLNALSITLVTPIRPDPIAILHPIKELGAFTVEELLDRSLGIDDYGWRKIVIAVDELGDWTVIVEPNGYLTSFPRTLEALSDGGRAGNVYWNVNAVMSFGWAVDGRLVRQFDPLLYDSEGALPEERDLPFGRPGAPQAAALALLERLTGTRVDRDWLLERARPAYVVPVADWGK